MTSSTTTASESGRSFWVGARTALAVLGRVLLGIAWAVFSAFVAILAAFDSGASTVGILVLFSLLALGPVVAAWLSGGPRARQVSYGVLLGWCAGLVAAWVISDEGMSDEEISQAERAVTATGTPAYYLGEEADGHELDEVWLDEGCGPPGPRNPCGLASAGEHQVVFWYDEACTGGEGYCWARVEVTTQPVTDWRRAGSCKRLSPVRGVPTVVLSGPNRFEPAVVLFTGESMVEVVASHDDGKLHLDEALAYARALRPLRPDGASTTGSGLPPPASSVLADVDDNCPPTVGE